MIIIGSDHTGIELKKYIIKYLIENLKEVKDVTNYENQDGDDYPDVAEAICHEVLKDDKNIGIAICGTGIGISISCNKIRGIRAALCVDSDMAKMAKKHNNANVLCLGARLSYSKDLKNIEEIITEYLNNSFDGDRHYKRLEKITKLEGGN